MSPLVIEAKILDKGKGNHLFARTTRYYKYVVCGTTESESIEYKSDL